jgi:hypothetical protein
MSKYGLVLVGIPIGILLIVAIVGGLFVLIS